MKKTRFLRILAIAVALMVVCGCALAEGSFVDKVEAVNGAINSFAWGPIMLVLLVGSGVYLSIRTGFIQVGRFGYIMKNTVGSLFRKSEKNHGKNLSPFQAVTTALAGTVGTGNIAGVTGGIFVGGPGAVVWWGVCYVVCMLA